MKRTLKILFTEINTKGMKFLFALIIIFTVKAGFSQTIADLEKELELFRETGYDQYYDKVKYKTIEERREDLYNANCFYSNQIISICNKILMIDKYNENALYEKFLHCCILNSYERYLSEQSDSLLINIKTHRDTTQTMFDNLIAADSMNPIPYILKAKILYSNRETKAIERRALLKKALSLDSLNTEANYELGYDYYIDLTRYDAGKRYTYTLKKIAKKTFDHFRIVFSTDKSKALELSYVLTQLATFLNLPIDAYDPQLLNYTDELHFPPLSFSKLEDDWKTNIHVNIIQTFNADNFYRTWYSKQLSAMQEPVLKDVRNAEIYRFTWLRASHEPIAIRIYKEGDKAWLVWKACNGRGRYEPGQLVVNHSKKLSKRQWQKFQEMLQTLDYWEMLDYQVLVGTSGAYWILEGISGNRYRVIDFWRPNLYDDYAQTCQYLLSLTNLRIKKKKIY